MASYISFEERVLPTAILLYGGSKYSLSHWEDFAVLHENFEKWASRYLKLKPGDVFIDVGAHIGRYTIPIAKIVGRNGLVVALEPEPLTYHALKCNVHLNDLTNVVALNLAAYSKSAKLRLHLYYPTARHSIVESVSSRFVAVSAMRLDDVVKEACVRKVDLIKIDVEGAEVDVLEGCKEILRVYKPRLIIEARKWNIHKVLKMLTSSGYNYKPIPGSGDDISMYIYFGPFPSLSTK